MTTTMTTDEARELLVAYMEQHFTDKTFHRYILGRIGGSGPLAGDFAWQLATALKKQNALQDALLEYFKASTGYTNTVGHEDATVDDERKAEERFDAATQAAHKAIAAAGLA